jgi:endonuclease G
MKARYIPKIRQLRIHLDEVTPKGGLERLADDESQIETMAPAIDKLARTKKEADLAREAVRMLARNEEPPQEYRIAHEAIIMPQLRPVIDIVNDSYKKPEGQWSHLGKKEIRDRIEAAIPSVGRVELPDDLRHPYVGTGFVVGLGLLMTNRHVAEIFCSGLGVRGLRFRPGQHAGIDFREENADTESIYVEIREVIMVHPFWDMALLRVNGLPEAQAPLRLSLDHPADFVAREVAVLGYPAFDERNDVDLQNRIFRGVYNVKRLQPGTLTGRRTVRSFENLVSALKHNASTLGGNSGSAVVDLATGEIVGLHFAGIYMDSNFAVPAYDLSRDQRVVDAGVTFRGTPSPSAVLPWEPRWLAADPQEAVNDRDDKRTPLPDGPPSSTRLVAPAHEASSWTIPLQVTVSVGTPTLIRADGSVPSPAGVVEAPPTTPDPNYSNRKGYVTDFLPGHDVPIPWLTDAQYANTARPSIPGFPRHVLPYNHFSLVMNRERRVAYFTAVNIDGRREMEVLRSDFEDKWYLDLRIDAAMQMDNEYYKKSGDVENPLDRGHLVRRLDPCWGGTRDEVIKAHHDTFHYTNCAPQHMKFNRTQTLWGGVEDYILHNANSADMRVTVFTGPVLRNDDPVYMAPTGVQVQIPLEYWKVVVWVRDDGTLAAAGYLLSQSGHIDSMIEVFEFGAYRQHQVAISEIEEVTELSFHSLRDHDVFSDDHEAVNGRRRRELYSMGDLII